LWIKRCFFNRILIVTANVRDFSESCYVHVMPFRLSLFVCCKTEELNRECLLAFAFLFSDPPKKQRYNSYSTDIGKHKPARTKNFDFGT
jgi:hypothetical protein